MTSRRSVRATFGAGAALLVSALLLAACHAGADRADAGTTPSASAPVASPSAPVENVTPPPLATSAPSATPSSGATVAPAATAAATDPMRAAIDAFVAAWRGQDFPAAERLLGPGPDAPGIDELRSYAAKGEPFACESSEPAVMTCYVDVEPPPGVSPSALVVVSAVRSSAGPVGVSWGLVDSD